MKTLCYSVRLKSLKSISDKAFLAISFDGSEDIIPKSCVLGKDSSVNKSNAYWIAAWILHSKNIQYSDKKIAWFDEKGKILPIIKKHIPKTIERKEQNIITALKR